MGIVKFMANLYLIRTKRKHTEIFSLHFLILMPGDTYPQDPILKQFADLSCSKHCSELFAQIHLKLMNISYI